MADSKTKNPTGINNLIPDGCSYGKVNRIKIENLEETLKRFIDKDLSEWKKEMKADSRDMKNNIEFIRDKVTRFMSPRMVALVTVAASTITALVVALTLVRFI